MLSSTQLNEAKKNWVSTGIGKIVKNVQISFFFKYSFGSLVIFENCPVKIDKKRIFYKKLSKEIKVFCAVSAKRNYSKIFHNRNGNAADHITTICEKSLNFSREKMAIDI